MSSRAVCIVALLAFALSVSAGATQVNVEIRDFFFSPAAVKVLTDDTVRWTNLGNITHTTTSGVPLTPSGLWDSGNLAKNATFSRLFATVGSFPYYCKIHTSMTGSVSVFAPVTIAAAAALADGVPAALRGATVTGVASGGFWVESPDRLVGLFVASAFATSVGQSVDAIGTMATSNGRKQLTADTVRLSSEPAATIATLGMRNEWVAAPPAKTGVLVTVWGSATPDQGANYFTISDGSPGSPVKISSGSLTKPSPGTYVAVTGIRSHEGSPLGWSVFPRTQSDIRNP